MLRFLWFKNIDSDDPVIVLLRFTRVVFGLTSSPFLLSGTVAAHLSKFIDLGLDVALLLKLLNDLYVDDSTTSVNSVDEGYEFYSKAKEYLSRGGFNLRKWATNSKELRLMIQKEVNAGYCDVGADDITYAKDELGVSSNYRKVLGVNWDIENDLFVF